MGRRGGCIEEVSIIPCGVRHLKVLSLVEMTFKTVIPIGGRHLRLLSLAEDDI